MPMYKSLEVVITKEKIEERTTELARQISNDFGKEPLVVIGVLKGSFIFFSDLIRQLEGDVYCEFYGLRHYKDRLGVSGEVFTTADITEPIEGKNVLVVEDIVQTGITINYIMRALRARLPKKIKSCCLISKEEDVSLMNYVGFVIKDKFCVGYGIDFNEQYRHIPYIAEIK